MFDLKVINSVLSQLEEERGIPRARIIEAVEMALATAYKKEYGKKGQIIRARFNLENGDTVYEQIKVVVDENSIRMDGEATEDIQEIPKIGEEAVVKPVYNPEHHIFIQDARKIKSDIQVGEELVFSLENKSDFGRIAAQTAKQVIMQKIREAEKISVLGEFGAREGEIVSGVIQRSERGNVYVDMGRATGLLPYEEQIPGERFRPGERVRAYLYKVEESPRGVFLKLSRSHPRFLVKLFEQEAPEIKSGAVEIKAVAREAGSRSKIAVLSNDQHIDPVGSLVGQRGVRVTTVMSELSGEKIDIIEWSDNSSKFIEEALSPAKILSTEVTNAESHEAKVLVAEDQQSLAIGKGGQNVRLAAKLTGWKIDIQSLKTEKDTKAEVETAETTEVSKENEADTKTSDESVEIKSEEAKSE